MSTEDTVRTGSRKRGVILDMDLKKLRGMTIYRLCEKLQAILPGNATIENCWVDEDLFRVIVGDSLALPEVPECGVYQKVSLHE